jgi:hypothetical protein
MILNTVNSTALGLAADLVVGRKAAEAIAAAYKVIDQAQRDAYDLGLQQGQKQQDEALSSAFDNGWDEAVEYYSLTEADIERAGDEGYIQGVADARARPSVADDNVVTIINELTQEAINGEYDASLVTDSGDEAA